MAPFKRPLARKAAPIKSGRIEGASDSRHEPLYDTLKVSAGALTKIVSRFFSSPIGGAVTLADTNMTNAGILPFPNSFLVKGIRLEAVTTDNLDRLFLLKLIQSSYVRFFVGTKDYTEIPVSSICGKLTADLFGGKTDGTHLRSQCHYGEAGENGFKFADNRYVKIGPSENFGVDFTSTIAHVLNSDTKIRLYLEGTRYLDVR